MFNIGQKVWIRRFTQAINSTGEAGILIYPYASPGCMGVIFDQKIQDWIDSFGDRAQMDKGILYINPTKPIPREDGLAITVGDTLTEEDPQTPVTNENE